MKKAYLLIYASSVDVEAVLVQNAAVALTNLELGAIV